jgi:hypothetical protein
MLSSFSIAPYILSQAQSRSELIAMPQNTVYLEASERTQDLLTIKWTLRSAGYTIASTWHDSQADRSHWARAHHWMASALKLLRSCDSLVVVSGKTSPPMPELAMMAAFALDRGLRVIWIGTAIELLHHFSAVEHFDTAERFRSAVVARMHAQPAVAEQLAA